MTKPDATAQSDRGSSSAERVSLRGALVGTLAGDPSEGDPRVGFRLRLEAEQPGVSLDLTDIFLPVRDFTMLAGLGMAGSAAVELDDGEQVPIAGSGQLVRDGAASTVWVSRLQFSDDGRTVELDLAPAGGSSSAPVPPVIARLTDRRIVLGSDPESLATAGRLLDLDKFDQQVEGDDTVLLARQS